MDKTTILCYSAIEKMQEVRAVAAVLINFQDIPKFGFAHHLYTEDTHQVQNDLQRSFVLVYVKSGHLTVQI